MTRRFFSVPALFVHFCWRVWGLYVVLTMFWMTEGLDIESTASWMREEGLCQAHRRTAITCTIDTTTLIMWICQNAAFGGRKNLFSPTIHSLSPVRGDSSLSQLFCSLFFDVCIVYVMFQLRLDWEKAWLWEKKTYSCIWGIDWVLFHHVDPVQTCTIDTTALLMWERTECRLWG